MTVNNDWEGEIFLEIHNVITYHNRSKKSNIKRSMICKQEVISYLIA